MKRAILLNLIVICIVVPLSIMDIPNSEIQRNDYDEIKVEMITNNIPDIPTIPEFKMKEVIVEEPVVVSTKSSYSLSDEEIDLLALLTMAEAEGESEEGKRLVIDTVLNRVDSEHFPNTIREVIYQPNQFTSMWNGRVDRCSVDDEICQLVMEEFLNQNPQNYQQECRQEIKMEVCLCRQIIHIIITREA